MQGRMLPSLADIGEIHRRLHVIFPEGTPQRGYCTREIAGSGRWIAPKHVYRMGTAQSNERTEDARRAYLEAVEKPGFVAPADRWFQDNTREPIRDETLQIG